MAVEMIAVYAAVYDSLWASCGLATLMKPYFYETISEMICSTTKRSIRWCGHFFLCIFPFQVRYWSCSDDWVTRNCVSHVVFSLTTSHDARGRALFCFSLDPGMSAYCVWWILVIPRNSLDYILFIYTVALKRLIPKGFSVFCRDLLEGCVKCIILAYVSAMTSSVTHVSSK